LPVLAGAATGYSIAFGQLTVAVHADRIVDVVKFLRDDPAAFRQLHRRDGGGLSRPRKAASTWSITCCLRRSRARPPARGSQRDHPGFLDDRGVSGPDWFERECYDSGELTGHPDIAVYRLDLTD